MLVIVFMIFTALNKKLESLAKMVLEHQDTLVMFVLVVVILLLAVKLLG